MKSISIFNNCDKLEKVDLSDWSTKNLKKVAIDDMTKFFEGCECLEVPDITGYHISHMFDNCDRLEN